MKQGSFFFFILCVAKEIIIKNRQLKSMGEIPETTDLGSGNMPQTEEKDHDADLAFSDQEDFIGSEKEESNSSDKEKDWNKVLNGL